MVVVAVFLALALFADGGHKLDVREGWKYEIGETEVKLKQKRGQMLIRFTWRHNQL